jgi:hypothetical protein
MFQAVNLNGVSALFMSLVPSASVFMMLIDGKKLKNYGLGMVVPQPDVVSFMKVAYSIHKLLGRDTDFQILKG